MIGRTKVVEPLFITEAPFGTVVLRVSKASAAVLTTVTLCPFASKAALALLTASSDAVLAHFLSTP